ncbi:MAG: SOS response-associated peptidase [Bacteroidetes bacterium]|nr:SOS response-associated peptidase [Bacteroidota bacterium]
MCYSISSTSKNIDLKKKFKKAIPPDLPETTLFHSSAFSFPFCSIITSSENIEIMRWGIIPNWFKGENYNEIASKTFNARSETITEKPSFKHLVDRQRCVIPITGFFEYQANGKEKTPFYVFPTQDKFFSIAGLYDTFIDVNSGEAIKSFTMVTCPANQRMAEIHNVKKRMPVFLDEIGISRWVSNENLPHDLMIPSPENWLDAHPVNPKILSGPQHNSILALEEYNPPRYNQGSLF